MNEYLVEVRHRTASVTNTGKTATDEVVQLYVGLRGTSVEEPIQKLKGFQCVALAPGQTKQVTFTLPADTFALWNQRHEFTTEPSVVRLWVAPDAARGQSADLEITE